MSDERQGMIQFKRVPSRNEPRMTDAELVDYANSTLDFAVAELQGKVWERPEAANG